LTDDGTTAHPVNPSALPTLGHNAVKNKRNTTFSSCNVRMVKSPEHKVMFAVYCNNVLAINKQNIKYCKIIHH